METNTQKKNSADNLKNVSESNLKLLLILQQETIRGQIPISPVFMQIQSTWEVLVQILLTDEGLSEKAKNKTRLIWTFWWTHLYKANFCIGQKRKAWKPKIMKIF